MKRIQLSLSAADTGLHWIAFIKNYIPAHDIHPAAVYLTFEYGEAKVFTEAEIESMDKFIKENECRLL